MFWNDSQIPRRMGFIGSVATRFCHRMCFRPAQEHCCSNLALLQTSIIMEVSQCHRYRCLPTQWVDLDNAWVDLELTIVKVTDDHISFSFSLQKKNHGDDFGFTVTPHPGTDKGLLMGEIQQNGALAAWNQLIVSDSIVQVNSESDSMPSEHRLCLVVKKGDPITHVNNESDVGNMIWELRARNSVELTVCTNKCLRPHCPPAPLRAHAHVFEVGAGTHSSTALQ